MKWTFGCVHSLVYGSSDDLLVQDQASPNPGIDHLDNLQVLPLTEELLKTDRVGSILLY